MDLVAPRRFPPAYIAHIAKRFVASLASAAIFATAKSDHHRLCKCMGCRPHARDNESRLTIILVSALISDSQRRAVVTR
jgi:hypothetical protein